MELTLSQLAMLIELTDREITNLKDIIESPNSTEDEVNDSGELSMQYFGLATALANVYKSRWKAGMNEPSYEELINGLS